MWVLGRVFLWFEFVPRIAPLQIELGTWNLVCRYSRCPRYVFFIPTLDLYVTYTRGYVPSFKAKNKLSSTLNLFLWIFKASSKFWWKCNFQGYHILAPFYFFRYASHFTFRSHESSRTGLHKCLIHCQSSHIARIWANLIDIEQIKWFQSSVEKIKNTCTYLICTRMVNMSF